MTTTNDSDELEALFDSIAADVKPPVVAPAPAPVAAAPANKSGDDDDLQALFDSVSSDYQAPVAAEPAPAPEKGGGAAVEADGVWPGQEAVFNRVGTMARQLHDTLRELGYEKLVQQASAVLPDAKDRLAYIANLTEQAACRVLNATDVANPLIDAVESESKALGARWDKLFANQMGVDDFKLLAAETRQFLKGGIPEKAQGTRAQLTEIMMAQDFQDLTGQVIKKVVALSQELEAQLMGVLIEVVPDERRTEEVNSLMNGPVVNAQGRADVVVNQQQVDDLLDSLGF